MPEQMISVNLDDIKFEKDFSERLAYRDTLILLYNAENEKLKAEIEELKKQLEDKK